MRFLKTKMVEAVPSGSQDEETKRAAEEPKKMKTNVNKNVVVRERDFKSTTTH